MKELVLTAALAFASVAMACEDTSVEAQSISASHLATADDEASRTCASYGFDAGSEAFDRCRSEVGRAIERRAAAAEAVVTCTPMGARTVCE